MTQEDKYLLLKDLCARLPYGVKVLYEGQVKEIQYIEPLYNELKLLENFSNYTIGIEEIKPYLRPMSSMTEEEIKDYHKCTDAAHRECYEVRANGENRKVIIGEDGYSSAIDLDWLNAHYFDYRGLIPMSLAIEVTKENNPYAN